MTRTIAICDVCGAEQALKTSCPLSESDYAHELRLEGWSQRSDAFRDVCPSHPAGVRE
jgi:hypothetical protein